MNSNKEIKMNFKKETKRCVMPKTYSEFKQMISKCYGINDKEINNLLVSYTDDEDDKVLITSDFDFEQAIIFMEKQKLNILRVSVDAQEKTENYELITKTQTTHSLDKSLASKNNVCVEEVKESPRDQNNKTISTIRDTDRNVVKLNEICNKVDNMTLLEKIDNLSNLDKNEIVVTQPVKTESVVNNFETILNKFRNNEIAPLIIKPICRSKRMKKHDKKEAIEPVFSYSNNEEKQLMNMFEVEMKEKLGKFLDRKFTQLKHKIERKTVKKSVKVLEKFISKKKLASQPLESAIKSSDVVHPGVTCDGCGIYPLVGHRFKCAVCHNFDFCATCEEKNKDSHPHPFILIRNPERCPHSISVVVKESCPIIQNNIPYNNDYKLADAIINNSIIAEVSELSSQCLTSNLNIVTFEDSKEILKTLKLKNNGQKSWPKPVYLTCIGEASTIIGNSVPIKLKIESGKENNVEIKLNNKDMKAGDFVSVWQLQNEKKESFGDKIVLKVKIEKKVSDSKPVVEEPKDIIINNKVEERSEQEIFESFVFQCQVDELKNAYNLRGYDDKEIKKAAVEAKGDLDLTFQILMNKK